MKEEILNLLDDAFPWKVVLAVVAVLGGSAFFGDMLYDFVKKDVPKAVEEVKHGASIILPGGGANTFKGIIVTPRNDNQPTIVHHIDVETGRVLRV